MNKVKLAVVFVASLFFFVAPAMALSEIGIAKDQTRYMVTQVATPSTTQMITSTQSPTPPASVTTTVKGGTLAASIIEWLQVAFGTVLAGIGTLLIVKIRTYFGILTTDAQKAQLQALAVNGINAGAAEIEEKLRNNPKLDIDVKGAVVASTIAYVQNHGAATIKALGLDPQSGDAVSAIKARIETALNDPTTPTAAIVTPPSGLPPTVNGVTIQGAKV